MTKHVLITGGSGFIGSHLCDAFLARGYAVTAVDNLVTGREQNLLQARRNPKFQFVRQDVCQPLLEDRFPLIARHGLEGVLHFACPASPVDFLKIPFVILAVDSVGTMQAVALADRHDARFVLASTSEVYGDPLEHPQKETYWGNVNPIGPRACYDEAKRFAEAYVSTAIRGISRNPLNGAIARIFNTYGPRTRPDDGRVVPELCMQALRGVPLTIHGDGKQSRSFCYITDLVDGILRLYDSRIHEPVNIGNPHERTMLEFADSIERVLGRPLKRVHQPAREDDPRRRRPDITRAMELLKWAPHVDLDTGLRATLEHFRTEL